MDYRKITVPFLNNKEIKKKADLFRKKHWGDSIPVDIEEIIELKLKIDIYPIPNLQNSFERDSYLTGSDVMYKE